MKFILIYVVMSLTNPQEKSVMVHKSFASYEECILAAQQAPKLDASRRDAIFCVSEEELLEIKINKA